MTGSAAARWATLDEAQQAALELGWEAFRTGNIGVGAIITDPGGRIVGRGRNRLADTSAPPGQVFGTSLAHAEINALANLPFADRLRAGGELEVLAGQTVEGALAHLWPALGEVRGAMVR